MRTHEMTAKPQSSLRPPDLPSWRNPPLDEVAFVVQFDPLIGLKSIHFKTFHDAFRSKFGGLVEDRPPSEPVFETFGSNQIPVPSFQLLQNVTPQPNVWFLSENSHELIQLHAGRFIQNWRKLDGVGTYPRFDNILPGFLENWSQFNQISEELKIGRITVNQCELSYFNNFDIGENESFMAGMERIFGRHTYARDRVRSKNFRLEPENQVLNLSFVAHREDAPFARLHVNAQPAFTRDRKKVVRLTITFRGPIDSKEPKHLSDFFAIGRESIVRLFDSMLSQQMQETFGRQS